MARQPRLILPNVAVHIIQRGNNRGRCFREDSDRMLYLASLRVLLSQFGCALHAYCLMTNHVHLLLTPRAAVTCALVMKELGQRYVQYFNKRYGRTGTLWEGRYRSCVAESARYVLACYRYIELNPVRAGIVEHPSAYAWSSYDANIGRRHDPMITPHAEFLALGNDAAARCSAYRPIVEHGIEPSLLAAIRDATNGGYPLGSESFKARLTLPNGRKLDRGHAGRPARTQSENSEKSGSDPDLFMTPN